MIGQMWGHANNWDPATPLTYRFDNSTYALIAGDIGPFIFKNEDEWIRENYGGELNYYLTRIVEENGSPHPVWWKQFVEWMGSTQLVFWGADNKCRKQCEVIMSIFVIPSSISCDACHHFCG